MTREQAYLRMLRSTTDMQRNIAMILEAKAAESEKMRSWFCNHLHSQSFSSHQTQIGQSLQLHDQVIEVIDGMTKLNQGMVSIMKAVLQQDEEDREGFGAAGHALGRSFTIGDRNE